VEQEGGGFALPVSSDIPDMHSKTEWYVRLKAVFKQRSERDTAAVIRHVRQIQAELGLPPYNPAAAAVAHDCNGRPVPDSLRVVSSRSVTELSDADIARVVPHVRCLRVVRTTAIADELQAASPSHAASAISSILEEAEYEAMDAPQPEPGSFVPPNPPLIHWYLALRAVDGFRAKYSRLPGLLSQAEVEAVMRREEQDTAAEKLEQSWRQDVDGVVQALQEVRAVLGLAGEGDSSCAEELVRAGACEPHVIAAFMGGLGSQMALKLLLHQYVPLNNSLLYNGYHCASQTWNL
jgi:amyloid beta precursor protein binding protein 1